MAIKPNVFLRGCKISGKLWCACVSYADNYLDFRSAGCGDEHSSSSSSSSAKLFLK